MDKQNLRKQYISIRNNIKNKDEKSRIIIKKILEDENYRKAKIIALYKSLPSEVNTDELIKYSIADGKTVVLPKVVCDDLSFYKISLDEKFYKSNFGVEEPEGDINNLVDKSEIDLIIVPGVCFDLEKNRLGFGKGYYDRFLENTELYTIGICFKEQIVEKLPTDEKDIKMKKIITDGIKNGQI